MNEELRSTTELERSREELQSINEELSTVNHELKGKVEELGHANNELNNLIASTAIATLFLDRALCITRFTPAAAVLFQLIPGDVGRPLTDLTHQLDYPDLRTDAARVLETLVPAERDVSAAGGRWFLARALPYRPQEDQIIGLVLTFVDITERKKAEEAIRQLSAENDARLRIFNAVINSAQDFIYHFDLKGRFTFANQPLRNLWQQPLEEIVGKDFYELKYPRELADSLHRQIREVIATQRPFRGRTPYTSAFGTRQYEYIFTPLMRPDGSVEAVAGVTRDITEQTEAEAALRLSEERLRLIIENARDYAIFSADLERRVTSWNFGAERLLGYAEGEIVGQSADVIFTAEDRAERAPETEASTAIAQGRAIDERWHVRKDGSRFWGSGVMMAMHDSSGAVIGLLKIFRDQTEAQAAQQALERSREDLWEALQENERARAEAEAAGKAKDHFLAVLSHELRTPLTPVLMAVQTLARRKDLPPTVADALEMIRRNVEVEAQFVDDLLDVTRIARGKMEIIREPMDLHEATIRAVEVSTPDIEAKRQQLTVSLEAAMPRVRGDFTRLQQVFWNLLKNASKFTPEGGEIRLRSRNEPKRIVVEISDTGIGIDADAFSRIFDPFEQANDSVTREFGGLGLGLAITKATVDAHDGALRVSSPGRNQGSTFVVELPLI